MNNTVLQQLARYLSSSGTRSIDAIGIRLGCSHVEARRHIEALRGLGIEVDDGAGRGYRLREQLEFLDEAIIIAGLNPSIGTQLSRMRIEASLDSTNSALQRLPLAQQHAAVILAEHQSRGRGRRGRNWHSPFARNLYLSLGWTFEKPLAELGCLSLVVAIATAQALGRAGLENHLVKWPNDLLVDGRKLCGCLVEIQSDTQGPCHGVVGVGINIHMPEPREITEIDQPWTDLHSHLPDCSRNALAAVLIEELVTQLTRYADRGFEPFHSLWQRWDGLRGQKIDVLSGNDSIEGVARGIDEHGALLLDTGTGTLRLHSGEVSVRKTK